jgi:membrane-associated protease RseP (regulator of RpoE activity)
MKSKPFTTIITSLAAVLTSPAFAIEAPADDAPPPPAVNGQPAEPSPAADADKPDAKAEVKAETAYLGVVSSDVPEMLAEHLGLKPGEGIIIGAVMPDGPAAKAGLAAHDIITRVGDKAVGSPQDLSQQVQSHKPGETIHLDVIQKGKAAGINVMLGTRPDQVAGMELQPLDQLQFEGLPKDLADRVRGAIQGNIGGIDLNIQEGAVEIAPQLDEAVREMRKRMENAMGGLNAQVIPGVAEDKVNQNATLSFSDGNGRIEIKSNDGGKEVTVRDADNHIIWTGPWDTEQDKAAAPEDIRKRMDRLNLDTKFNGKGLRFQFNGAAQPEDRGE